MILLWINYTRPDMTGYFKRRVIINLIKFYGMNGGMIKGPRKVGSLGEWMKL